MSSSSKCLETVLTWFYARKQSRFNVTTKNITPGGSHSVDSHLSSIDREFDRVCRRVSALAPVSANDVASVLNVRLVV